MAKSHINYVFEIVPELLEQNKEKVAVSSSAVLHSQHFTMDSVELRIENMLAESRQRFEAAFEVLAEGVIFQDNLGRIVLCNDAACNILGLTIDQMEGRSEIEIFREDGTPFTDDQHPATLALRTAKSQQNVIAKVVRPGGSSAWIKLNSVPIVKEDESTSVVTSISDVTDLVAERERLREELKTLQKS